MPAELLLPLFALTLLANAALIALAIRALRRGRFDGSEGRHSSPPPPAPRAAVAAAQAAPPPAPPPSAPRAASREPIGPPTDRGPVEAAPIVPAVVARAKPRTRRPTPVAAVEPAPPTVIVAAPPTVLVAAPPEFAAAPPRARSAPPPATAEPPPTTRRGRRKFSLPPLDDDHEKVNRSIESFLAGVDGPAGTPVAGDTPSTPAAPAADTSVTGPSTAPPTGSRRAPTTIALVAIAGMAAAGSSPTASERAVDEDAVTMLERTLRGAARGSDEVRVEGHGRFRIVLPATGELAARAYLRRIRASVEPQLEAADPRLHLVVATATALNVPIRTATAAATRRLDAALEARANGSPHVDETDEIDEKDAAGPTTSRAAAD
jgi:hypothetical protein